MRSCEADLESCFFVVYADVIADVDLLRMLQFHRMKGALATLAVHPNDHPYDSDRVVTGSDGRIKALVRKEDHKGPEAGALASAALYVMDRRALSHVPSLLPSHQAEGRLPSDFARDLFPQLVAAGEPLFAYRTTEYIKDMGTPDRRERVERDVLGGTPPSMRFSSYRLAVLTDRDGVLIHDAPRITKPEEIDLLPGVAGALAKLNRAGVLAVCCTNQPVISWGDLTFEELHELHTVLEGKLGAAGAFLDAFYFCPHHPDRGFAGERAALKFACSCRKPLPGMLVDAVAHLGIDRRGSVFIGDRTIDLRAARAAGVLGIGVLTGTALKDDKFSIAPETPIVPSFSDAVDLVLETVPSWEEHLDEIERQRVVLLGGPSRSGKTVAASALALALKVRGTPVLHVSLDRFIESLPQRRKGSSLIERTGFELARRAVARIARHEPTLLPSYDSRKRETKPGEVITWADGVLVVEGLLATTLDIPSAVRIEMVAPSESLRKRRKALYAWKGLTEDAVADVLREREEEDREIDQLLVGPRHKLRFASSGRLERI